MLIAADEIFSRCPWIMAPISMSRAAQCSSLPPLSRKLAINESFISWSSRTTSSTGWHEHSEAGESSSLNSSTAESTSAGLSSDNRDDIRFDVVSVRAIYPVCARNPRYKKIVKLTAKTRLRLFRRQAETDEVMQTVTRGTYACVYLISGDLCNGGGGRKRMGFSGWNWRGNLWTRIYLIYPPPRRTVKKWSVIFTVCWWRDKYVATVTTSIIEVVFTTKKSIYSFSSDKTSSGSRFHSCMKHCRHWRDI